MAEIKAGDEAPDFEAVNDRNEKLRLSDFRGRRVVIYFYPKDNTPGCTRQACGFRDAYDQVESQNAVVLGVSPDSAKSHQGFRSKHALPFPLVVDSEHKIAEAYGVWQQKSLYGRKYMGTIRSHFVIDEQGKVIEARYNVRPADSPALSLKALAD